MHSERWAETHSHLLARTSVCSHSHPPPAAMPIAPTPAVETPAWLTDKIERLLAGPCPLREKALAALAPASEPVAANHAQAKILHLLKLVHSQYCALPSAARTLEAWFLLSQLQAVVDTWVDHVGVGKDDLQTVWNKEGNEWTRLMLTVVAYLADVAARAGRTDEPAPSVPEFVWDTTSSNDADMSAVAASSVAESSRESRDYRIEFVEPESSASSPISSSSSGSSPIGDMGDVVRISRRATYVLAGSSLVGVLVRALWRATANVRTEQAAKAAIELVRLEEVVAKSKQQIATAQAEHARLAALELACVPASTVQPSAPAVASGADETITLADDESTLPATAIPLPNPRDPAFRLHHPQHAHPLQRVTAGGYNCNATPCANPRHLSPSDERPRWQCRACDWDACTACGEIELLKLALKASELQIAAEQRRIRQLRSVSTAMGRALYGKYTIGMKGTTGGEHASGKYLQVEKTSPSSDFQQRVAFTCTGKITSILFAVHGTAVEAQAALEGWEASVWTVGKDESKDESKELPSAIPYDDDDSSISSEPSKQISGIHLPATLVPKAASSPTSQAIRWIMIRLAQAVSVKADSAYRIMLKRAHGVPVELLRATQSVVSEKVEVSEAKPLLVDVIFHQVAAKPTSAPAEAEAQPKAIPNPFAASSSSIVNPFAASSTASASAAPVNPFSAASSASSTAPPVNPFDPVKPTNPFAPVTTFTATPISSPFASAATSSPAKAGASSRGFSFGSTHAQPSSSGFGSPVKFEANTEESAPAAAEASDVRPHLMYGFNLEPPNKPIDAARYELGQKFKANVDGLVHAIVFYRHERSLQREFVANLWDWATEASILPEGRKTVLSSTLPAAGWCTVPLETPVALTAGREYAVSWGDSTGGQ
jgi:hypothetical protein